MMICGHLDNDEDPGEADCHEKGADHSEGSAEEAKAEKSESFWKTFKTQPSQNLETLGKQLLKDLFKV